MFQSNLNESTIYLNFSNIKFQYNENNYKTQFINERL